MNQADNNDEVNKWKDKFFKLLDEQEKHDQENSEKEQLLNKIILRLTYSNKGFIPDLDPFLDQLQQAIKSNSSLNQLKTTFEQFSDVLLHLPNENQQAVQTENLISTDIVARQIIQLFDEIDIPVELDQRANLLAKSLQTSLDTESFKLVLEESITLLLEIKEHDLTEQEEIEDFLSNLTQQLTELSHQASGASEAHQEKTISRNKLDQSVSKQMIDLQKSSAIATNLDPLKQLIISSLESITEQIAAHQQEEENHQTETQIQLIEMSARIQAMESESKDLKYKLQLARDKALRDPLTGLPNRLAYDERLATEFARWQRNQTPLTMIIWDIDHFKKINDNFGHKAGDKTLSIIARLLSDNCRKSDFVARFGGEEFIMLLSETTKESGFILAEKIRKIVEKSGFNAGGEAVSITISCGITQFIDTDDFESFFERADQALYTAKNLGRNQCVIR
jgi:diguanylate cyclase